MTGPSAGVALLVMAALAAAVEPAAPPEVPRDVGLVERASTRLAQVDVTVTGARGAIEGLGPADFEVRLNDKLVRDVIVDDLCIARPKAAAAIAAPTETPAVAPGGTATVPAPKTATATYLLYFDMTHLTQGGRRGAIDAARGMLPKLIPGGNRAMIVASAADLKTVLPLTDDLAALDAALATMIDDGETFDTYSATEENRLADIIQQMSRGVDYAVSLARRYAAEERWRQERDLRRLSMVLGRLAEVDPPKAALYFADTMRENAGEHYLSFFSGATLTNVNGVPTSTAAAILADAATGALPLDRVMNEASSFGIRFFTVEGQGIQGPDTFIQSRSSPSSGGAGQGINQASPVVNTQRTKDAQGTLVSLAAETGGRAFLNGVSASRMASQILDDMSCVYLLSFDPRAFPQDKPLALSVTVHRPKVKVAARGRLVIQSDASRLTSRVLSAFAAPTANASADAVRIGVIPVSYKDGNFRARVQVWVPGSSVPDATWDLGASLVSRGVVWQDGSGRIQVAQPNTPVAFEKDMDFAPGDYEMVAVAHEVTTDTLASKEARGSWPKIDVDLASFGPIAVSQQAKGGFLRNGTTLTQGAMVVPEDQPLRPGVPTAVISLVCRAKDQKKPIRVVRALVGEAETPVGATDLDLSTDRCGQIVDLIPPKVLGPGSYRFVITATSEGAELARAERTLVVPEHGP